jgi:transcriptional regulator with XRE-family HTH domain
MKKRQKSPLDDLKGFREARGENQTAFWTRFGVTQSGGSRYESGRALPTPVAMLLVAFADGLLDEAVLTKLKKKSTASST